MTVGIAAVCDWGRAIVLASDQMISTEDYSGDQIALKIWAIHRDWGLLYAGDDLAPASPIYEDIRDSIFRQKAVSLKDVTNAAVIAYRRQFRAPVDSYLSRFGLDLDSFKKDGRAIFGDSLFAVHHDYISRLDLECEFLIAGFDQDKKAHVFGVVNPGEARNEDTTGFSAIGGGAAAALSTLFFHSFNKRMDLAHALYHVCEAKFMTERPGIGEATSVVVLRRGDIDEKDNEKIEAYDVSENFIEEMRRAWNLEGKPRFPQSAESIIKAGMEDKSKLHRVVFR